MRKFITTSHWDEESWDKADCICHLAFENGAVLVISSVENS